MEVPRRMIHALTACPVCGGQLKVTELSCSSCHTIIHNTFDACRYCSLSPEQAHLLEVFLRNRGNVRSTALELGVSYPTAGHRLDALLTYLGLRKTAKPEHPTVSEDREGQRRGLLEQLDRGEITAEEATRRLKDLQ